MDVSKLNSKSFVMKRASSRLGLDELLSEIGKIKSSKICMQLFDPDYIVNKTHIVGSYSNALLAFECGTNKADSIAMEMLLFAALTDQIKSAVSKAGAKSSNDFIIFSNEARSFRTIKKYLSNVRGFEPSIDHVKKTARLLGVELGRNKTVDESILERLALSRLDLLS